MKFAWDEATAISTLKKHGVDFREAATVLDDPLSYTFPTPTLSTLGRLLVVAHTESDETIRIISARVATGGERKVYEEDDSN